MIVSPKAFEYLRVNIINLFFTSKLMCRVCDSVCFHKVKINNSNCQVNLGIIFQISLMSMCTHHPYRFDGLLIVPSWSHILTVLMASIFEFDSNSISVISTIFFFSNTITLNFLILSLFYPSLNSETITSGVKIPIGKYGKYYIVLYNYIIIKKKDGNQKEKG